MFSRLYIDGYKTADIETEIEVMNQPTDMQLKQALAKMLPEQIEWHEWENPTHPDNPVKSESCCLCWTKANPVLDTELLHVCWLVEETIQTNIGYCRILLEACLPETRGVIVGLNAGYGMTILHASWQQRVIALAKVKEIEIV